MTASAAEHFDFIKMLLRSKSLIFRLFCGGSLYCETGLALSRSPAAIFLAVNSSFFDSLAYRALMACQCPISTLCCKGQRSEKITALPFTA